ncbi:hypothetical protein C2845_PM16G01370 [Panicum miliaceum]|uniref:DUF4220 domain-containing protein n=1 Tax=Panicum miliaceum TaxID=4540 RepID=A0A3L6PWQ2_PANMI|nr:hypothetical protein C2845_PM16G01370 [Panicum miliaceum]
MARGPLDLWNDWATQILVLLSLTLQVVLLLLAGIRRREASPVPTFILWLAYQLADSTAIYAVGHLSLSSVPVKHQLVAFWAPFLLLRLRARGEQALAAPSAEPRRAVPRCSYAERTWALKRSNLDSIRSSLKKEHVGPHHHFHPPDYGSMVDAVEGDEFYVRHELANILSEEESPTQP